MVKLIHRFSGEFGMTDDGELYFAKDMFYTEEDVNAFKDHFKRNDNGHLSVSENLKGAFIYFEEVDPSEIEIIEDTLTPEFEYDADVIY